MLNNEVSMCKKVYLEKECYVECHRYDRLDICSAYVRTGILNNKCMVCDGV